MLLSPLDAGVRRVVDGGLVSYKQVLTHVTHDSGSALYHIYFFPMLRPHNIGDVGMNTCIVCATEDHSCQGIEWSENILSAGHQIIIW